MRYLSLLFVSLLLSGFVLANEPITVYLAGDSTMADKLPERRPETGWGEVLQQFFDADRVRVANHAANGRSTRRFIEEGRWQRLVESLKPGDYVFIQFGHNDAAVDRPDRYTPPEDYRQNLINFVAEVRAKQANPVLMTPVVRRRFDSERNFYDVHGEYPDIVRAVAAEHNVPLIDMHRKSEAVLKQYGVEGSRALFLHLAPSQSPNYPEGLEDNTHFSPLGAELMARQAVEGIRELDLALARYLKGERIPASLKWSERMALSEMKRNPNPMLLDFQQQPKWEYTHGLVLRAIDQVRRATNDRRYSDYVRSYYDYMVEESGDIKTYDLTSFNIDRLNPGRLLFTLHEETGEEKYLRALRQLRRQVEWHPRTREGGFWHKLVYPHQMWLDGAYMGPTFYAQYASRFNEPERFEDVAWQIILMDRHMRDPRTGLLYHGWDESRLQQWSNPETGTSPNFWGRAIGWYAMAIVDILEFMPEDHPRRAELIDILERTVVALMKFQDPATGLWYQVVDQGGREGNYLEASASTMYVYSIAKAVNRGWLDESYRAVAEKAYEGILATLITVDEDGEVHINQVCAVAGLGGNPYRDGSYEYYVSEPVRSNDPKATGPFVLASLELNR